MLSNPSDASSIGSDVLYVETRTPARPSLQKNRKKEDKLDRKLPSNENSDNVPSPSGLSGFLDEEYSVTAAVVASASRQISRRARSVRSNGTSRVDTIITPCPFTRPTGEKPRDNSHNSSTRSLKKNRRVAEVVGYALSEYDKKLAAGRLQYRSFVAMNKQLKETEIDVQCLSRLGCRKLVGGVEPLDFMTLNACDLFYEIAQGEKNHVDEVCSFVMGPLFEMDETFQQMVFDVAVDFNIPSHCVNSKVSDLILHVRDLFVEERKNVPHGYDKQRNYHTILENAALIVKTMETRVDFLSVYGLCRLPESRKLKDLGKVKYGIGKETAERIIKTIQLKG